MSAKAPTFLGRCPACGRYKKRSNEANKRLWAIYAAMSDKLRPDGETYSPKQYHLYCKQRFLGCEDIKLPGGRVITEPKSTQDLDVDKFADYMGAVESLAAEHGVYLDE